VGCADSSTSHGHLVLRGEKRFEREASEGLWSTLQCVYGNFQLAVPLPALVVAGPARASYRDGVLRVGLPKAVPGKVPVRPIRVN